MAIHMIWLIKRRFGFFHIRYASSQWLLVNWNRLLSYVLYTYKKWFFINGNACYKGIDGFTSIEHIKIYIVVEIQLQLVSVSYFFFLFLIFIIRLQKKSHCFFGIKRQFFPAFIQHEIFLFVELFY